MCFLFLWSIKGKSLERFFLEVQTPGIWKDASNRCSTCFFSASLFFYWRRSLPECLAREYLETLISAPYLWSPHLLTVSRRVRSTLCTPCEGSTPTLDLFQVSLGLKSSHFPKAIVDHSRSFKKTIYFPSFIFFFFQPHYTWSASAVYHFGISWVFKMNLNFCDANGTNSGYIIEKKRSSFCVKIKMTGLHRNCIVCNNSMNKVKSWG